MTLIVMLCTYKNFMKHMHLRSNIVWSSTSSVKQAIILPIKCSKKWIKRFFSSTKDTLTSNKLNFFFPFHHKIQIIIPWKGKGSNNMCHHLIGSPVFIHIFLNGYEQLCYKVSKLQHESGCWSDSRFLETPLLGLNIFG